MQGCIHTSHLPFTNCDCEGIMHTFDLFQKYQHDGWSDIKIHHVVHTIHCERPNRQPSLLLDYNDITLEVKFIRTNTQRPSEAAVHWELG